MLSRALNHFAIYQQCYQGSSISTSLPALVLFLFKKLQIFYGYKVVPWYFTVVFICISLMTNDHLFIYLLAIYISFQEKCLFKCFVRYLYIFLRCLLSPEGDSNVQRLRNTPDVRERKEQKGKRCQLLTVFIICMWIRKSCA